MLLATDPPSLFNIYVMTPPPRPSSNRVNFRLVMCIVYILVLSTSGSDVLLDTDFGKVIDFANLICLHGEHKYNNSAKKFFFNDFPRVVKGLRSCWYVMFNYFLGY